MKKLLIYRVFLLGMYDGITQPVELSSGRTWEQDDDANESYDKGVNLGQCVANGFAGRGWKPDWKL